MIEVIDFHKSYGKFQAVRGISFSVGPGQVLGLVGPNGAGKTTTMRAIAGINSPSHGTISVAGFDVGKQPLQAKSLLAYIPDDPQLFDDLTVNEHLTFTASAYQVVCDQQRRDALLAEFALQDKRHAAASSLSRGMRQKLVVCCGYLRHPQAILFDEPFTGLDPLAIRHLKQSIRDQADSGAAVVISSHLLAMVEDICSDFLILAGGRSRFLGPAEKLRQKFGGCDQQLGLEEIFFRATQAEGPVQELTDTASQNSQQDAADKDAVYG